MNTTTEETSASATSAAGQHTKAKKKATRTPRSAHVGKKRGKPAEKATPAKKAPASAKKVSGSREGSKAATVLDLLERPGGVTVKELMEATGWQPHSVRGFLSGTLKRKMGFCFTSTKLPEGERTYRISSE